MWAKILRWVPNVVAYAPRIIDAAKAAWSAFRHAPEPPKDNPPSEPRA